MKDAIEIPLTAEETSNRLLLADSCLYDALLALSGVLMSYSNGLDHFKVDQLRRLYQELLVSRDVLNQAEYASAIRSS